MLSGHACNMVFLVGSELGLGLGLGLELVSKVVSWTFFELSLLITLKPQVGRTKFPAIYTLYPR